MSSLQTNPAFLNGRTARQARTDLYLAILLADWKAANNVIDFEAPALSMLVGGAVVVDTVSNDSGTDTLSPGDDNNATRYHAAINLKAAAATALTPTYYETDGHSPAFRLTRTPQNGDATTLSTRVWISYVTRNKSDWTEGAF